MASQVSPFVSIHGRRFGLTPLGLEVDGRQITSGNPTYGNTFYVHSATGDDSRDGKSPLRALATIDAAVNLCTANQGDAIIVLPNHTETLTATDITVDVAGVSIIGIGHGGQMPHLLHNHADAEVSIVADDVLWQGIRHSADVTAVKVAIEIEDGADNCIVRGCKFDVVATTTDEFLVSIRTNDASNFALIEDCDIDMGLGGAVAAISFTKDTDGTTVRGCRIQGDYSTAVINGITTASTNLDINGNLLINGTSGGIGTEPGIELVTGSTGTIRDNYIVCNLATKAAAVVADTAMLFQNFYNEDVSGAATGGLVGTASADDL